MAERHPPMRFAILCGGGGTRLWPASREHHPKQFLPLGASQSLVSQTVLRLLAGQATANPATDILLISNARIAQALIADLAQNGLGYLAPNVIAEPARRNTAPAIALAASLLLSSHDASDDDILVVLPADHQVVDSQQFVSELQLAATQARELGVIVTLGIPPTHPETGFGYIEVDEAHTDKPWLHVRRFVEKPDFETAERYVASQRFLWNAGVFVASIGTLRQAFTQHQPAIAQLLTLSADEAMASFASLPDISFDYAVMEQATHVKVVPCRTEWSDVGSWDSVYDLLPKDRHSNAVQTHTPAVLHDTNHCLVWQSGATPARRLALLGLSDCLVVDTPDATLIAKRGASQQIKQTVADLKAMGCPTLLHPQHTTTSWGASSQVTQATPQAPAQPQAHLWTLQPSAEPLTLRLTSPTTVQAWWSYAPSTQTTVLFNQSPVASGQLITVEAGQACTLFVASATLPVQVVWLGQPPQVQQLASTLPTPQAQAVGSR